LLPFTDGCFAPRGWVSRFGRTLAPTTKTGRVPFLSKTPPFDGNAVTEEKHSLPPVLGQLFYAFSR